MDARRGSAPDLAALPAAYFHHAPAEPVVNGEPWYEGHPEMDGWRRARTGSKRPKYGAPFSAFDARYAFWKSVLGGTKMGHGYGAQRLWNWKRAGDSEEHLGGPQIGPTWQEGLDLAGGRECGVGAEVLRTLPWWKLQPCPERVEVMPVSSVTAAMPHLGASCDRVAGEAWIAYVPLAREGGVVTLKGLEDGVWRAVWIDPRTGERHDAGVARAGLDGCWRSGAAPASGDWVLLLVR